MTIQKYLWLSALPFTVFSGWAQQAITPPNTTTIQKKNDSIMVTANRFPQPISSILAPIDVVTRTDIDRWQSTSLNDVLRRLPGVNISQSGGARQVSSLFIRGAESRHVLILIDGIRLNQAGISGSSDLSQIPISLVQRIEYIRGPRSAVYGSDAIGGVINIITQREDPGSTLTAGTGSHSYQNYGGSTRQRLGDNTAITLAGNYDYSRGYDIVAAGNTGAARQPDRDGYLGKMLWTGLDHQFNEQFNGFARAYGFENRSNYDGFYTPDSPLKDTRELISRTYDTGLRFRNGTYASQLIFNYNHSKDYNYDPQEGRYAYSATLDDAQQYNVQWGNTLQLPNGTVSAGADWQKQATKSKVSNQMNNYILRNTGVYLTGQQQVNNIILEGALRGDDNSQFGRHSTWQTHAGWEFIEGYRLIASYGTAYKAPNLLQLYSAYGGNRHLKPEESKQWEGALEGLTGPLTWRLSAYRNDIDQLIDYRVNRYYNIGKATIKGMEWTGAFDTGPLSHQVSLEYLDPRNSQTNKTLLRRAKQQAKYQLDWQMNRFDWSITYHYLGQRYDTDFNANKTIKLGGVSLWDLAVSYSLTARLTVRARIANLFDKNYETVYGYPTPGREYYFTGSYNF